MATQEQDQSNPQTEGQPTDDVNVTEIFPFLPDYSLQPIPPEVLTNPQEAHSVVLEEMQRRRVQPPSRLSEETAAAVTEVPATEASAEVVAGEPATDAQALNAFCNGGLMRFVDSDPASEAAAEDTEPTSVKKKGKGRRNQKKRQAPPQVWQWLNANFERKTERGIIVQKGKARFHVDFRDMALAEDGTAIRFQDGDKVRVRVMSMDRTGGLPQASMLGKVPAPVQKPATAIQAEVVGILAGHAVLGQMRPDLPSPEAMEAHERFANTVAEAVAQGVLTSTEAPAEAVDSEPATEAPAEAGGLMFGELWYFRPTAAQAQEPEAQAETDPVD
jgi:hypothetical protein